MNQIQAQLPTNDQSLAALGSYRLMTAEIVFGEDQPITWRDYDVTPGFPRLRAFLDRWRDDPSIRVKSVTVVDIDQAAVPAYRVLPISQALH